MYTSYSKTAYNANTSTVSTKLGNESIITRYESGFETIQREIDNYTRKMEQEKRKYFSIQEAHKTVEIYLYRF
jgi:hypothetical protein